VACMEVDKEGNFYYVDPRGLHKVVSTGNQNKTLATGWRNPNGMSLGPDGTITVAPQEGERTPASMIDEIPPGKMDMYFGSKGPRKSTKRRLGYDPHLVYLPRHIDNSTGSQVWVTSTRWGELEGQLLNLSYGRSEMQLILRDKVGGAYQGAVVPMGLRFSSGAMRGRFHPNDGQLYVVGMKGWVTNAVKDGCLQRVRYTKKPFDRPVSWKAYIGGLLITFDQPLNKKLASDVESYAAERWNYEYSEKYGSEEHSVKIPGKVGHDAVEIESATLLADGKSIYLQISNMTKAHVMQIRYDLENTDGAELTGVMFATINKLDLKR